MARAELESGATKLFAKPVQEWEKPSQQSAYATISLREAAVHNAAIEEFIRTGVHI